MHKTIISAAIAAVIMITTPTYSEESSKMTKDEEAVLATIKTMTSNLEKGDIDNVMETYRDDAVIIFEPGAPVSDEAIARQIFAELSALKPNVTYPVGDEVYVAGDTAIHIAPWTMVGEAPDGTKVEQGGLSVAVLRRLDDGSWKMVIDNPYSARLLEK